jgi:hypothetical protein
LTASADGPISKIDQQQLLLSWLAKCVTRAARHSPWIYQELTMYFTCLVSFFLKEISGNPNDLKNLASLYWRPLPLFFLQETQKDGTIHPVGAPFFFSYTAIRPFTFILLLLYSEWREERI